MKQRILKDIANLKRTEKVHILQIQNENKLYILKVIIKTNKNSLYNGDFFLIRIDVRETYPFEAPRVQFVDERVGYDCGIVEYIERERGGEIEEGGEKIEGGDIKEVDIKEKEKEGDIKEKEKIEDLKKQEIKQEIQQSKQEIKQQSNQSNTPSLLNSLYTSLCCTPQHHPLHLKIPTHPHIYHTGDICFSLKNDWSPVFTLEYICVVVMNMLNDNLRDERPIDDYLCWGSGEKEWYFEEEL